MKNIVVMGGAMMAAHFAFAASGCGTVTDMVAVNKPPMADIYRLDKRGIATGGAVAQIIGAFTPLGSLFAVAADTTVGYAGSAIRRSTVASDRTQEITEKKWEGVYEVTYKPDFGEPISITIRDSEIRRYGLELGSRVVMFDPARDVLITTDDGPKVTRTRPSIHVPVAGFWSTRKTIPVPINGELTDDYKKFCYANQVGPDFQSISGPWNPKDYKQPYLTSDELDEAFRIVTVIQSNIRERPQVTDADKNQAEIDLQVIELAIGRNWKFKAVLHDASEQKLAAHESRIASQLQKLNALKQSTGLESSLGIEDWLSFVSESMTAKEREYLAVNAKDKTH